MYGQYIIWGISSGLFVAALILFLKRPFFSLSVAAVRQLDIMIDPTLPEADKDRLLLVRLTHLLYHLLIVLGILAIAAIISFFPVILYLRMTPGASYDLGSLYFYLSTMTGGTLPLLFFRRTADYSFWSKLLHTIILDNYNLARYLFNRQLKSLKNNAPPFRTDFVLVTGLARGGTTALTNLLFDTGQFHSIRYSNMPFLMAPGLWRKIYSPKPSKLRERAHGDRVLFNEDSVEAFEEYFFKVFLRDSYLEASVIKEHPVSTDIYQAYLQYQQFFSKPGQNTLYLAKNNNSLLRYRSLRNYNRDFKVFLLFRRPDSHALSLLRQHRNFSAKQHADDFVLSYMNWLGHYEFGLNHKVFDFGQPRIWEYYNKDDLNYWLCMWINYYQYVLTLPHDDHLFLVDHQDLLDSPYEVVLTACDLLKLNRTNREYQKFVPAGWQEMDTSMDKDLLAKALGIYNELKQKKIPVR